jgi:hypothetical protein
MFCANAPAAKTIAAAAKRENEPLAQACAVVFILCNATIASSLLLFFCLLFLHDFRLPQVMQLIERLNATF